MTLIVYQDGKLYTDTTCFTDYSGSVPICKAIPHYMNFSMFAGTCESISKYIDQRMVRPRNPQQELQFIEELVVVSLDEEGVLRYAENGNYENRVYILDEQPILFGNNALRKVASTYMKNHYTWDKPLMVELVETGIFEGVVEVSPKDNLHYLHTFKSSELLDL